MKRTTYAALGEITKSYRDDDGLLHFEVSKATGPDLDLDKQIVDPDWAKSAMERWFTTGGNLREQHSSIAAGKALTLESRGDGEYVSGVVVDPTSALKVETGVLTGLSIGIKGARVIKDAAAPNGRIVGGDIIEVSLVDRPANPTAKLALAKAAGDGTVEFVEEWSEDHEGLEKDAAGDDVVVDVLEKADAAPDLRALLRDALTAHPGHGTVDEVKALLTKADDDTHDADQIAAVRDGLVDLIIAELRELQDGEDELWDISQLLCALNDLVAWWESEAWMGETASPAEQADGTGDGDAASDDGGMGLDGNVKAVDPDPAGDTADTEKTTSPEAAPAALDAGDISKMIADAVAQAVEPLQKALGDAQEELAKVQAMAVPGGPARTRSPRQSVTAARIEILKAEQAEAARLASVVKDQQLAAGYRERVRELEHELSALLPTTTS